MFGAIMRVRSVCRMRFIVISRKGFVYVNTYHMDLMLKVQVKCLKLPPFDGTPRTEDGKVNYKDFFGKETNLTVSDN
jgi:asparaginyl-tRNA synthetase